MSQNKGDNFQMCLQSSEVAPEKAKKAAKKPRKKAVHSKSFVQNIYRGVIEPEQMFPYPEVSCNQILNLYCDNQSDIVTLLMNDTRVIHNMQTSNYLTSMSINSYMITRFTPSQ